MSDEMYASTGAKLYEFDDKRLTIYEWARILTREWGIPVSHTALLNRLARHWSIEEVLTVRLGERRTRRAKGRRQ